MKKEHTFLYLWVCGFLLLGLFFNSSCLGQSINTNSGKNFWFGYTETTDGVGADYVVYITTLKKTNGTVSIPGSFWSTPFTAFPGTTTRIVLPSADVVVSSFSGPVNQAVNVIADSNISVFAAIENSERSDNACILPVSLLGNQYFLMDYSLCQSFSEFMVVAQGCKDSVEIIPSKNVTVGGFHHGGVPYTEVLQTGQVLLVQSDSDLTGSMVQSLNHAETGVIAGANWNCVTCNGTANPFYEELYPINTWGKTFVFLPTAQAQDQCRVLSEQNGTVVTFSTGSGPNTVTLNAGQHYDTAVNYASPVYISGTNPISVGRFLNTGSCNEYYITNPTGKGDPSEVMIDATEQMFLDSTSFYVSRTPDIDSTYVQIVTRTPDMGNIFLDNINIGSYFNVLGPNPAYAYASLTILPGSHVLTTTGKGFVAYTCGLGFEDAMAAPAGVYLKEINITVTSTNPSACAASDGTATANATGIPPFSYTWSNGQTTQTATGLSAGIYTITVSDSDCVPHTDTAVVNLSGHAGFTATVTDTNPNCTNAKGKSTVSPSGGSSPYTYNWSNGQTSQTATGLTAGTYTCTVTDKNGCKYFATTTIKGYIPPSIGISPYNDSICGDSSAFLHVFGINTNVYKWTPAGSGLSCYTCASVTASPTVTTTYTISGTDSNGCTASTSVTIYVLPTPRPVITGKDSICLGSIDTLSVTGGVTYSWSNGSTSTSTFVRPGITRTFTVTAFNGLCSHDTTFTVYVISAPVLSLTTSKDSLCQGDSTTLTASGGSYKWLIAGNPTSATIKVKPGSTTTYSVVITNPCGKDTLSKTIHIFIPPVISTSGNKTICRGSKVSLSVSGGTTYLWSPGGSTNASITVTPASTTTYTASVSNGLCTKDTTITITVDTPAVITITPPGKLCYGDSTVLTATGGGSYKWSNGATTSSITVKPLTTTSYTVVVSNGCIDSATTSVSVYPLALSACCDTTIVPGASAIINASNATNYLWSPSSSLSCDTCARTIATPSVTTTYTVITKDPNGCTLERIVTILVEIPCADFTVPNIFTPNNDGINDDFVINILNPATYSISIYDRWGKVVYSSTDPTVYWNGKLLSTDYLVPDGVYYYIIKATCGTNNYLKKGFVQLVGEQ